MNTYKRGNNTKLSSNFSVREFECKCGKCKNTLIDSQLVKYLQLIRNHFGKAVTITSGYRCADHNKAVGGASKSKHTLGQAADIKVQGVEPKEVAKYAESIGVKGIGLYDTFTHIDSRASKAFWYGNNEEYRESFINPSNSPTNTEVATTNKIVIFLPTLRKGASNKYVNVLQALLGIFMDGVYGTNTEAAVKEFQKKKGLAADGVVGVKTWEELFS